MKRLLVRLTFMLIGAVIVIGGNLLNYADMSPQEVKSFDEIHCRKIRIYDSTRPEEITLDINYDTPLITIRRKSRNSFEVHALSGVKMFLEHHNPDTGTKTSEIRLTVTENSAGITHFVKQK